MRDDVMVAPSMLSADFMHLADELASVSGADYLHYDVMDGHFVPNLTFGPEVLRAVVASTELPVDAHLMVSNPEQVALDYVRAGASIVSFHIEAQRHARRIIDAIHGAGARAGVAVNPGTPPAALDAVIEEVDTVLVMSVNPGFGGQRFIESTFSQLAAVRRLCEAHGASPLVEVDGGVATTNAERLCAAGANVLVAGSAIFRCEDRAAAIDGIRALGMRGRLRRA